MLGGSRVITVTIDIPFWLERPLVWFVLFYRRLRYGYPFRRIPLTQGRFAIVDPEDFPHLNKYKWRICKTKGKHTLYAERGLRESERTADGSAGCLALRSPKGEAGSRILMHRQIFENLPLTSTTQNSKLSTQNYHRQIFENPSATQNSTLKTHNCHRHVGDGLVIDHINRNGLDNRRANLRPATIAQNAQNSRMRKNRCGYKGVWFAKDKGRFRAAIWHNNKRIYLGYFDSPIAAAKAYDEAAKKFHKEFAVLNFD